MRYPIVPPDIGVVALGQGNKTEPMSWAYFFVHHIVPVIPYTNAEQVRILAALSAAIDGVEEGDEYKLRDDEHETLEKGLANAGLKGPFLVAALPWYGAVFDAPKKSRAPEADADEAKDEPTEESADKKPDAEAKPETGNLSGTATAKAVAKA